MPKRRFKSSITSKHIYHIRKKLVVTQRELAEMLGVTYDTVSSWEQGRRCVGVDNERKILEFCRVHNIKI